MDESKPRSCFFICLLEKAGDTVTVSGPYGEFFINESEAEMLYIGGGAGMAPMRSHLYHLFRTVKTGRKVTYWYGGRSKRELFYVDHFRALEKIFLTSNSISLYLNLYQKITGKLKMDHMAKVMVS